MPYFGEKRCLLILETADSYRIEANNLSNRGEAYDAVQMVRDGLKAYPDEACLQQALGHQLLRLAEDRNFLTQEESYEIFGCFEKAFMMEPNTHTFVIDYARALRKAERFGEAEEILIALYNDETPSDPNNVKALTQLGKLYSATGQEEWAACCYYACMQIEPKHSGHIFELNKIEMEFGIETPTDDGWNNFMDYAQDVVDNAHGWGITLMLEAQKPETRTRMWSSRTRRANPDECDLIL